MHVNADLVLETTTTTGTGTLTLAGAVSNYLTFAAEVGEGNTCSYTIQAGDGQLETGVGTVVGSTLERTTLISSSTGSKLNLPVGTHQVGVTANSFSITPSAVGSAVEVSGADPGSLDGLYLSEGTTDGKVAYMGAADVTLTLAWSTADARWELGDSAGVKYVSSDDVETPDQATAWGSVGFDAPLVCQHMTYPEVSGLYVFDDDTFQDDGILRYVQDVLVDAAVIRWYPNYGAIWILQTIADLWLAYSPSAVTPSAWKSCLLAVSGAGEPVANGEYFGYDFQNNRVLYSLGSGDCEINWSGSSWNVKYIDQGAALYPDGTVLYHSVEDVQSPDLCSAWIADAGPLPVPVVALVEPNPSVVVSPVPAPSLAVTVPSAGFPVVTDGGGAFMVAEPAPASYPLIFTALAGWDTPLGLAAGLLEALEIQLAPNDGEAPGAPLRFNLHVSPNKWGCLKAYIDFDIMIAEWAEFSMSVSPGDSVMVYSVTVQW